MKRLSLLLLVLIAISCNKKDSKSLTNLHLTGTIKGLKQGTLYIQKIEDTSIVVLDTIDVSGEPFFESNINIASPEVLYLVLDRGMSNSLDNNILFFAEPGEMKIETSLDLFLADAKITGSKNNDLLTEFKKKYTDLNYENLELIKREFLARKKNDAKSLDSVKKAQEANIVKKYLYVADFAIKNGNYEVAPYVVLTEIPDINVIYLDSIQKSMSPRVAKSLYGKKLTQHLENVKSISN